MADAPRNARSEEEAELGVEESRQRPKTMSRREMLREQRRRERAGEILEVVDYERPASRIQCASAPRPCLFVACKHHLYLDVNPETGSIKLNFPGKEVWELEETCALDLARRGGMTLEELGKALNITRERARQLADAALQKLRAEAEEHELEAFLGWEPGARGQ